MSWFWRKKINGKKIIAVNEDEIRGLGKVSLCKFVIGTKKPTLFFFFPLKLDATWRQFKKKKV